MDRPFRIRHVLLLVGVSFLAFSAGCSMLDDVVNSESETLGSEAFVTHNDQLAAAETFTAELSASYELANAGPFGDSINITQTYAVDRPNDRALVTESSSVAGDSARYTDGNQTFVKTASALNGNVSVVSDTAPYNGSVRPVNTTALNDFGGIVTGVGTENISYERTGTDTVDGTDVVVYSEGGADLAARLTDEYGSDSTVTNATATLHRTDSGLINYVNVTFDLDSQGTNATVSLTVSYSGLDSTTVTAPAWTANATAVPE